MNFYIKSRKIKRVVFNITSIIVFSFLTGCLHPDNSWSRGTIGAVIAKGEDGIVVKKMHTTFKDKSAAILPGDQFVSIDDTDVKLAGLYEVSEALSGPVGVPVTVTVLRDGTEYTFKIERILLSRENKQKLNSTVVFEKSQKKPVDKQDEKPADKSDD
ncbi:MAG: PDZ domain-containing protein [Deltaproteobacteria bacterium]|nr:PDZ domain-containing protein [Deltaproteobacteria bacterium]